VGVSSFTPASPPPARRRSQQSPFLALFVLVAASLGVFALELVTAPLSDTLHGSLVEHGALYGPAVDHGEWWRILTAGFLHSGLAHLVGNLIALVVLGGVLTLAIGPLRMALTYLAGLLGSSLAVLAFAPDALTVGASGAIFGLAGGALLVGWRRRRLLLLVFAGAWILYTLSSTLFVPGISQAGHLGGLASGAVCGWLLVGPGAELRSERAALGLVSALLAALFALALVV
jgi:membrane associated rhomboid family serine protease